MTDQLQLSSTFRGPLWMLICGCEIADVGHEQLLLGIESAEELTPRIDFGRRQVQEERVPQDVRPAQDAPSSPRPCA